MDIVVTKNVAGHGLQPQNVITFSCRNPLPVCSTNRFSFEESRGIPDNEPELRFISKLRGVCRMSVYGNSIASDHDLNITKHTAYTWEEIEPEVLSLLRKREDRVSKAAQQHQEFGKLREQLDANILDKDPMLDLNIAAEKMRGEDQKVTL